MKTINVTIDTTPIIEGKEYYYTHDMETIKLGTAVKCESCGKACAANSVTVMGFSRMTSIKLRHDITEDELGYDDETGLCVCSDC